jgi:hypothetical protein
MKQICERVKPAHAPGGKLNRPAAPAPGRFASFPYGNVIFTHISATAVISKARFPITAVALICVKITF